MSHIELPIFPSGISLNSAAGPQYETEVVVLNSGDEQRNQIWDQPLIKFDIGVGIKDDFDLEAARKMFYLAQGRYHSFNYLDHNDQLSCIPQNTIANTDQLLYYSDDLTTSDGDGAQTTFQVVKEYFSTDSPVKKTQRTISKLQTGTLIVALDGTPTAAYTVDITTGIITFSSPPGIGVSPTCGFKYYIPVRFDIDFFPVTRIEPGFERVPITLIEVRQ